MTNFIGNPKTTKLEAVQGDPGTGLYSYRYDEKDIKDGDIQQVLTITELMIGSLDDVTLILNPKGGGKMAEIHLAIKNRSNILLGMKKFGR